MALKLPDSAVPMGDFPVAKAVDIDFDDGENLQEKLDNGTLGVGGGSSTPNESAGIELWVSGESYEKNDFVSYNDYIYRCKIANNDIDFVEDNWQKQSDTHVEITEQEILDLLDLTDEELETMAQLIDDSAISLNKTYSSSKICADIRQCLQDSKDLTLSSISGIQDNLTSFVATTNLNDFKGSSFMIGRGTGYNNETTNIPNGVNGAFVVEWFPYGDGDRYGVQKITLVQPINNKYVTFERSLDNNNWMGWQRVCTTTVADVPETTVDLTGTDVHGSIKYMVKSGICYVSAWGVLSSTAKSGHILVKADVMPKPIISCGTVLVAGSAEENGKSVGFLYIDSNKALSLHIYPNSVGDTGLGSFSYPVAE